MTQQQTEALSIAIDVLSTLIKDGDESDELNYAVTELIKIKDGGQLRYQRNKHQAIIFCEVTCSKCGIVEFANYRNADTIRNLKQKIKDWKYCGEQGNLCPDCYEKTRPKPT